MAPPDLNPFLAGDVVDVTLEASGEGRYRALDLALVERPREEVIGTVERSCSDRIVLNRGRHGHALKPIPDLAHQLYGQVQTVERSRRPTAKISRRKPRRRSAKAMETSALKQAQTVTPSVGCIGG